MVGLPQVYPKRWCQLPLRNGGLKNPLESSTGCGGYGGGEVSLSELGDGGHSLAVS